MDSEHTRILLLLAQVLPSPGYLAEWHIKPRHKTSRIDGNTPTMYAMRDLGLVEELADLHERWRLTPMGRQTIAPILARMLFMVLSSFKSG